jgi:purine-binding chemotaxis protein CheW
MSDVTSRVSERAAELRRHFDRAFAEPIHAETAVEQLLLGISVAGQPYAIRLSDAAGVHADKKITPVPGSSPALRGIAGFRGALLPVYDLHVLLGHAIADAPRWLVVAAAAPVALTFTTFEGQLRAGPDEILPRSVRSDQQTYARDLLRTRTFTGPILHLPSVLDAIKVQGPEMARPQGAMTT